MVEHPTLNLGAGHDLRVGGLSPALGWAWNLLQIPHIPPSLCLSPAYTHMLALSLSKPKKKQTKTKPKTVGNKPPNPKISGKY